MANHENIMVVGIHTEVGKTMVSTALCLAWKMDYWKPFQTGSIIDDDTYTVKSIVQKALPDWKYYEPLIRYPDPVSPHIALEKSKASIDPKTVSIPQSENLLLESAGGLMSPISKDYTFADFAQERKIPLVLVIKHYLGSINHSLLCLDYIYHHDLPFKGIVWNGETNIDSENVIIKRFDPPVIGSLFHIVNTYDHQAYKIHK